METTAIIDLNKFRSENSKVFTGRNRGLTVRKSSKIDELEKSNEKVKIIIPSDLFSINPSFFEEFLYNVVQKLGKEAFYEKFEFENKGEYEHVEDLEEGIKRILRRSNAL